MTLAAFHRFEQAVLDPLHAYRRVHEPASLLAATAALALLGDEGIAEARVSDTVEFRLTGWILPRGGMRLRRSTLESRNPGYRVGIQRMRRSGLGRRGYLLRAGFVVSATGPATLPPFRLAVADRSGTAHDLPGSNFTAVYQLARLADGRPPAPASTRTPLGYLDEIRICPVPDEGDRSTWLAALLHSHPQELFEIVDSPAGRFLADTVGRLIRAFPLNARWSDRFTMSVSGAAGQYHSDLEPLAIRRIDEKSTMGGGHLPTPLRMGRVVRWHPGSRRLQRPGSRWFRMENATLQDGGTVTVNGALVVYEGAADPAHGFVTGQQFTVFGSRADREIALLQRRPASGFEIPEGILLAGRSDDNWFHWLVEYLPRALLIPDSIGEDVPLIVSGRTPRTGLQALRELSDRPVITVDPLESTRIQVLHVLPPQVQVLDTTTVPWAEGLRLNLGSLEGMRKRWGLDDRERPMRRVFLRRRSRHRGLLNEDVLAAVAAAHGLEIIDPGTLDFAQQRELFSSAELVVGASGAVMANYIMMRDGSRIIGLTSDQLHDFVLPAALAGVVGAEFSYVTGPSDRGLDQVEDRQRWMLQDFRIDPRLFESELAAALQQLSATH